MRTPRDRCIVYPSIVINYIFGSETPTPDQFDASDMNNDGILNVLDVILIVEQITS